jgi:hypothetical protein
MCSPVNHVTQNVSQQFAGELRSFFTVTLLNLVFGALVMAFGLQFIVIPSIALAQGGTPGVIPLLQILAGIAGGVLGIRWIMSSVKILKGISPLRREYRAAMKPVPDEILTDLIIRLVSHYRDNGKTIRRMIVICALGGGIYIVLGVTNIFQGALAGSISFQILGIITAGMNIAIGMMALLSSLWFHRYTTEWDRRLEKASRSEETLRHEMERT